MSDDVLYPFGEVPVDDAPEMPDNLLVGPYSYQIEERHLGPDDCGRTTEFRLEVEIHNDLVLQMQRSTLLHEALHCCNNLSGLRVELGNEEEEKLVARLEGPLLGLLQDNPDLLEFLTGRRFA